MWTSDAHVIAYYLAMGDAMNVLYSLVTLCVVYKLGYIARQVGSSDGRLSWSLRFSAGCVGTIIVWNAISRFGQGDSAQWLDISRELAWCAFLLSSVFLLRRRLGNW